MSTEAVSLRPIQLSAPEYNLDLKKKQTKKKPKMSNCVSTIRQNKIHQKL